MSGTRPVSAMKQGDWQEWGRQGKEGHYTGWSGKVTLRRMQRPEYGEDKLAKT